MKVARLTLKMSYDGRPWETIKPAIDAPGSVTLLASESKTHSYVTTDGKLVRYRLPQP